VEEKFVVLKEVQTFLHFMLCDYLDGNFEKAKFWQLLLRSKNESCPEAFFELDCRFFSWHMKF